jgi:hypothetical protein
MKPGFAKSVPVFMVEVVGVFSYFSCFPGYVGTVGADVGYDVGFVEVDDIFSCCSCLATTDCWFSSLVCLMCSEIPVEM